MPYRSGESGELGGGGFPATRISPGSLRLDLMIHRLNPHIMQAQEGYNRRLGGYLKDSDYIRRSADPDVIDLAFGDPHEMPSRKLVECLQRHLHPKHVGWFAYARGYGPAQDIIAKSLSNELNMPIESNDILMTNGAFGGLMVCLRSVCAPGDEVIYLNPAWFYYESMIMSIGARPVPVSTIPGEWNLDIARIKASITERTSAIIVNSPNNPTGVVYSVQQLQDLADVLTSAAGRYGNPIYLLSDESYRRIVFDDGKFTSPIMYYPYSFLVYTYTKSLLIPAERVGYVALTSMMPCRDTVRDALSVAQLMTGWSFPNSSLMYAVSELESLTIPLDPLVQRRDLFVESFRAMGYTVEPNQGTFYLLVRAPIANDRAYAEAVARNKVLVLPGAIMGAAGYFRVSLTVTDRMAKEALPRFLRADSYLRSVQA